MGYEMVIVEPMSTYYHGWDDDCSNAKHDVGT